MWRQKGWVEGNSSLSEGKLDRESSQGGKGSRDPFFRESWLHLHQFEGQNRFFCAITASFNSSSSYFLQDVQPFSFPSTFFFVSQNRWAGRIFKFIFGHKGSEGMRVRWRKTLRIRRRTGRGRLLKGRAGSCFLHPMCHISFSNTDLPGRSSKKWHPDTFLSSEMK